MIFDVEDMRSFADRHRGKHILSGPHWSTIIRFPVLFDEYEKTLARAEAAEVKVAEWLKSNHEAVGQFNAGFEAGEKGRLDPYADQPHYDPDHDEWRNGYYAGSFDRLTARIAELEATKKAMKEQLDIATDLGDQRWKRIAELEATLKQLRTEEHYECEDCWYSCPKSGECCDERQDKDDCLCGTDKRNAIIDSALKVGEG